MWLVFYMFFLFGILDAGVMDHLSPIKEKGHDHSLRNIDFIYMINLDHRPEKYEKSMSLLHPYGIQPYRFSAIYGWELNFEVINDIGVKYSRRMTKGLKGTYFNPELKHIHGPVKEIGTTYFSHCLTRGAIGCILSHLSVLKDAYESGYETIWVMEDDIEIVQNPHILCEKIDELDRLVGKENWDILYTDKDPKNKHGEYISCGGYAARPNFEPKDKERFVKRTKVNNDFWKIGSRYGTYSMILRRSGIEKLLNFFDKNSIFLPCDMEYTLPEGIQLYTVSEDIIAHFQGASSDIGSNKGKNWW